MASHNCIRPLSIIFVMEMPKGSSLKKQVSKSVVYLSLRRIVSTVLATVGTLFIARVLGPENQGLYATALGIQSYAAMIGLLGIRPYLIKTQLFQHQTKLNLAFSFELIFGTSLFIMIFLIGSIWYVLSHSQVPLMLLTLAFILPFVLGREVPLAVLESRFEYNKSAFVETVAQVAYYGVAITLVQMGYGAWSLVWGYLVGELITTAGFFWAARYFPRWHWDFSQLRPMLAYGVTFALSDWASGLQRLVPSLVVFPILGASAVGYVAMSERLIALFSFAKGAIGRAVFPAFSRLQHDTQRLVRAVEEGAPWQMLGLGVIYAGASLLMPYVTPILLGKKWDISIIAWLFALLSIRSLLSALTALEGAVLYAIGKNLLVFFASAVNSLVLGLATYLLLLLGHSLLGVHAYGIAGIFAALITALIRHTNFRTHVGKARHSLTLAWFVAGCAAIVAPLTSAWLYGIGLLIALGLPQSRRVLIETAKKAASLWNRKRTT